jgi:CRP-like cAMP-binding protein
MPGTKVSRQLRKQLGAIATPVRKQRGAILFRAGQPGRGAFLIRTGQVRLTLDGNSSLYPARTLGSGAVVGLPATFSGEPYSLTAEVVRDCRLDFVPRLRLMIFCVRTQ